MYRLVEAYDDSETVVLSGQSLPLRGLIEDDDGFRWLVVDSPFEVRVHEFVHAHRDGAAALIHPPTLSAMTIERFMEVREDGVPCFSVPSEAWQGFSSAPSYPELVEDAQRPSEGSLGTFAHLHTHSEFSALDGLSTMEEIVAAVKADGQRAVAITDHGTVAGHPALQRACDAAGIKPIFGLETYFIDDRLTRPEPGDAERAKELRDYKHLILLAKNDVGLRNLWAISTESYADGFYYKPRIDWATLERYHEGIIATSACLGGVLSSLILDGRMDEARARLGRFLEIFGEDFYLELQPNEQEDQKRLNKALEQLAAETGMGTYGLVVAADAHFPTADDEETQKIWLAVQTKGDVNDDYWHLTYLETEQEIRKKLDYLPQIVVDEAIANTVRIAEQCTARIEGEIKAPVFSKKGGPAKDVERLLDLCEANWHKVQGKSHSEDEYAQRFEREMNLLVTKGFCGYFLMVADYTNWVKDQGFMVGPARGSAGGSLVAYLAGIIEVDPVEHDLLFERFLTEGRMGLPDIDMDFPPSKRAEIMDYIRRTYGSDHIVRVGTHLRLKNKGVLENLFRSLGEELPSSAFADQKRISSLITDAEAGEAGLGLSWEDLWAQNGDALAEYAERYPKVFHYAERLVGRLKSYGQHAAGIVISTDEPLDDRYPLRAASEDGGDMISQFAMDDLEALGLVKCDFLWINTLDILQTTVDLVKERTGRTIDFTKFSEEYEDPIIWEEIGLGNTLGIFQIETASGTKLAKQMKPQNVAELADMITLVRPGPMRSGLTAAYLRRRAGEEAVSFPDPRLADVLAKTHGTLLYQEDIMQTCMVLGGYSSNEADKVRKILGKKKVEAVQEAGQKFVERCTQNGMDRQAAVNLWAQMAEFAKYSFNRAHAFGYALLGHWTAWAKFHYPVEFLTAALTHHKKDRTPEFVKETRRMGFQVLPPDINESGKGFKAATLAVRYGLDSIKGVGEAAVNSIVASQPYASFDDFMDRRDSKAANAGVTLLLARIGAFDTLFPNRRALVQRLEAEKDGTAAMCVFKRLNYEGPNGLPCTFDWDSEPEPVNPRTGKKTKRKPIPKRCTKGCRNYTAPDPIDPASITTYSDAEIRTIEADMLGGHLSSTPFDVLDPGDREALRAQAEQIDTGPMSVYTVAGTVVKVRPHRDSAGRAMGFLGLETEAADLDLVAFNEIWKKYEADLKTGTFALAEVRKTPRGDGYGLQLVAVETIEIN